jgi:hypothetical protein
MTSQKELTIFIVTLGRYSHLANQLYRLRNFEGYVVILDGGNRIFEVEKLKHKPRNIAYIQDSPKLYLRFRAGERKLFTKYAMTLPDDDHLIDSGVNRSLDTVNSGAFSAAYGRTAVSYRMRNHLGFNIWKPAFSDLTNRVVNGATPREKVLNHSRSYVSSFFYSVMTSELWKNTFCTLDSDFDSLSCIYLNELAYEMLAAASGSLTIIDELIVVRNKQISSILPGKPGLDQNRMVHEWNSDKRYRHEKDHYVSEVAKAMVKSGKVDYHNATLIVTDALVEYSKLEAEWVQSQAILPKNRRLMSRIFTSVVHRLLDIALHSTALKLATINFQIYGLKRRLANSFILSNKTELSNAFQTLYSELADTELNDNQVE